MKDFQVAIDGPAGSGKSTISKLVANKLGFTHIDTGAMYRAVTLEALNRGIDLDDESKYDFLDDIKIRYSEGKIFLNGVDVSKEIRTPNVTNNASAVAKVKVVRDSMVRIQQDTASEGLVLMDGRDIGYVVLPNADVKVFLTASVEARALRRYLENKGTAIEEDLETIKEDIALRDYKDSNRAISPLKKADDAILIDTTKLSIEEVVEEIITLIKRGYKYE